MANENRVVDRILNVIKQSYTGIFAVFVIIFMILPVPKVLVDVMMILNLSLCILVLLTVISIPRAADFESFPRIILFQTMFGLGLNITSTRLILSGKIAKGLGGSVTMPGQSDMVQAFSKIVTGNNIVIGFIIFIILIIVQVVVITKGATRISEVSARFTLDSMQPKLFDVDNRLNSGAITDEEAQELKAQIRREIDFYSTMDGASKFVSGNVKAGIAITVVNLIGGFIMGMIYQKLDFNTALQAYPSLTIGDGLLSQLPSMMISFATGILVTSTKTDDSLAQQVINDFSRDGRIYEILGAVLVVLGVALGFRTPTLLIMLVLSGAAFFYVGMRMLKNQSKKEEQKKEAAQKESQKTSGAGASGRNKFPVLDTLSIELGFALIPLVDAEKGAELTERIKNIRSEAVNDMGLMVPNIHIQDNMTLEPNEYVFKIRGIEAGRATLKLEYYLAINTSGMELPAISGEKTRDPTFGLEAYWVSEEKRQEAEDAQYTIIDPATVIATHITELIRANAADILSSDDVKSILDQTAERYPILVQEVLKIDKMSYGKIERILKNLLEERVSIRGIDTILSAISNYAPSSSDVWFLTQKVREALGLQIAKQYTDRNNVIHLMVLSPDLAEMISTHAYFPPDGSKPMVALDPVNRRRWASCVSAGLAKFQNMVPIILCPGDVRQLVRSACEMEMPGTVVLSESELYNAGKRITIDVIGEIADESNSGEIM